MLYKAHEFLFPDIFAKCAFRFCSSFMEMFSEVWIHGEFTLTGRIFTFELPVFNYFCGFLEVVN